MSHKDDCQHVKAEWPWRTGEKFNYTAHIVTVKGPKPGMEIVDDVHVEPTGMLPASLQKWLQEPCENCKRVREKFNTEQFQLKSPKEAVELAKEVTEAMHCHHNENSLLSEVAREALNIYMLKGPSPDD